MSALRKKPPTILNSTEKLEELNEELEVLNSEARRLEERIGENVAKLLRGRMRKTPTAVWRDCMMSDLFKVKHGFAFDGKFFTSEGEYILLTPGNFHDEGGFKLKDKEKYYVGDIPTDYVLKRGDLLVAMTEQAEGLLGNYAIVPENNKFLHNQRLGLILI